MNLIPRSLAGRLRLAAAIAIIVALVLAGITIALILQRFVIGQIDQRLDGQVFAVAAALQRGGDGKMTVTPMLNGPPFDRPGSGWTWQVTAPDGELVSASLAGEPAMPRPPVHGGRFDNFPDISGLLGSLASLGRPAPADGPDPHGQKLHWRILTVPFGDKTATVTATAPYSAIYGPLRDALVPLALALIVLGLLLFGAMVAQVRIGLRPLAGLRAGLADVRAGRQASISADQPSEVLPLVHEVNSLLAENAEGLARARRHVANLAHGLKTPLAALGLALEKRPESTAKSIISATGIASMRSQLNVMERLIRHHLARARAAVLAGPARASTNVAERLVDLRGMMANVHRERGLKFDVQVTADIAVAVEMQDFDEILGNLLDNACKWARARVVISANADGSRVTIDIEDDGPGLDPAAMPEAMRPGRRIDEAPPGHGFGLPIAAELTELYGGSLELSRATVGGLRARVILPQSY
ncbi:HAMP domain-containing histidine kinase [Mesorhizobium sp. PAMC28654]|uniref:sensor histidine kinase n=1 Tax=Mesorhizobium sp. PAMC28654 TaxID=2880934 RepID=UPI001D0AFCBA|nr:HAMP domain-containing sensor histidine kinase [Mesorhizobium sp. PAMC28654]UDL90825.1 HAMP domain-containing histidine kinase [Mesorhizobium sp. PAMC28654]